MINEEINASSQTNDLFKKDFDIGDFFDDNEFKTSQPTESKFQSKILSMTPAPPVLTIRLKKRIFIVNITSDTDEEPAKKKFKRKMKTINLTKAILEKKKIKDKGLRRKKAMNMLRFETKQKQKNQHHEAQILMNKERNLRLELKIARTNNKSNFSNNLSDDFN